MFFNDLYSSVAARFSNWLEVSTTDNEHIADLALDYINRAIQSLLIEASRGWDYLTDGRYALTLGGSTGLECTLPTDCGVVLAIYCESGSSQKPLTYYSRDGKISAGFRFVPTYSRTTGLTGKIIFFNTPATNPYLKYQIVVPDMTGSGIEFLPFPADLVLIEALRIRCMEKGLDKEWSMAAAEYERILRNFKAKHQNQSAEIGITVNDANGYPITGSFFDLAGNSVDVNRFGFSNDTDLG